MSLNQLEDVVNPNLGWLIAPVAFLTDQLAFLFQVDPTIPELLYGIAAVLYALAAIRRSTREETSNRLKSTTEALAKSTQKSPDDTIDIR